LSNQPYIALILANFYRIKKESNAEKKALK